MNTKAILAALGALLYGASPIDLIPDLIPILGLTDDVAIIALVVVYIMKTAAKRRAQPVSAEQTIKPQIPRSL